MTLRQKTCDKLRQAIINHHFPPGTRLVERELCGQLGVSRTSVREALRHLESEQLITMVPHKGPFVAKLNMEELREMYEVRAAIEGLACEKFAEYATDQDIALLQNAFRQLEQAAQEGVPGTILRIKAEFYRIIFVGSQCTISQAFVASLMVRIEMMRGITLAVPGRKEAMIQSIRLILEAASRRDGLAMKIACVAHVRAAMLAALSQVSSALNEKSGSRADSRADKIPECNNP